MGAEHLACPGVTADARLHHDRVAHADVPGSGLGTQLRPATAFFIEDAGLAGVAGAGVLGATGGEDVEHAPTEEGSRAGIAIVDERVHEAMREVHGAEALDGAGDVELAAAFGARDELGGLPDLALEEFDLVAAEFLDACATDGGLGLREEFEFRAVLEDEAFVGERAVDLVGEGGVLRGSRSRRRWVCMRRD